MSGYDEFRELIRRGDFLGSVRVLRAIASSVPAAELARSYYETFAVESIDSIVNAADEGEALYLLGMEFWDAADWKFAAIDVFRSAVEKGSERALEAIGDFLDWLGAYEEAIPFLERAREKGIGKSTWIAGLLGHARQHLGDSSREVEELLREGASEHSEFGVDYVNLLRARGAFDDAIPLLRDLVAKDVPGSPIILGNLLDDEFDDPKGAIDAYQRGIEQGDSHSAYNLAILYRNRGAVALAAKFRRIAQEMGDLSAWPDDVPDWT